PVQVSLTGAPHAARARVDETEFAVGLDRGAAAVDGARYPMLWSVTASEVWISTPGGDREFTLHTPTPRSGTAEAVPTLDSPMPGTVVAVLVDDGAQVQAGAPIVAVEAMKMEHVLRAPS